MSLIKSILELRDKVEGVKAGRSKRLSLAGNVLELRDKVGEWQAWKRLKIVPDRECT